MTDRAEQSYEKRDSMGGYVRWAGTGCTRADFHGSVEALRRDHLNHRAEEHGLMFGPGTSFGLHAETTGTTVENVESMEVLLSAH